MVPRKDPNKDTTHEGICGKSILEGVMATPKTKVEYMGHIQGTVRQAKCWNRTGWGTCQSQRRTSGENKLCTALKVTAL